MSQTGWRLRLGDEASKDFVRILTYTRDTFGEVQFGVYRTTLLDAIEALAAGPDLPGRANGSSAVAAAAYRSASRLEDERLGRGHDFSNKAGVIHSEVMLAEGAPERWRDRETLWNEVEAGERRKDAQLAREVEFSIPREMDQAEGVRLAQDFVRREFVARGMVADLNVHWDRAADGSPKPHAHVMLTMREVKGEGFGKKVRDWNATAELQGWRERWAEHVNGRLAALGIEAQIDHRSLKDQGVELEPQSKIGPAGARREERGEDAERATEHRQIARRNGDRIIAEPRVALDAITRQQSTFTDHDLARFIHRHSDDKAQFDQAMGAVRASADVVALGRDGHGRERFSTREMLAVEERLERSAAVLADRSGHRVPLWAQDDARKAAEGRGLILGEEQRGAFERLTQNDDLALVIGFAGTGKSAMLGVARAAWEASGFHVHGAALSGIAAENLEAGSGIRSRTIASLEHAWEQGREKLTFLDVLVVDEAGMIGSRQMERVLAEAERAGAKVVMVGDPEQLQAIEAGAAFRALAARHGASEITEVRRQREGWQRRATRELATGLTAIGLERYDRVGLLHGHMTTAEARAALIDRWQDGREAAPEESRLILAHTRADVAELNQLARDRMRAMGELGQDHAVQAERGERFFAAGDRVIFLRNERSMGVKNGSVGQVAKVSASRMEVRLDDGRRVAFEVKDYADVDHGYAVTIHKAQGVTVDQAYVLASDGLDRHSAYVALTRHRNEVHLHYGYDQFRSFSGLTLALGRERAKDTTLDYPQAFAERRGIIAPERTQREVAVDLTRTVRAFALAYAAAEITIRGGVEVSDQQKGTLERAGAALAQVMPEAATHLRTVLDRNPGLAAKIMTREGAAKIMGAMTREIEMDGSPELRAARFVEDWRALEGQHDKLFRYGDWAARQVVEASMRMMAGKLKGDSELQEILRERRHEFGLSGSARGQTIDQELASSVGRERGMER